jgi:hypothetical protein
MGIHLGRKDTKPALKKKLDFGAIPGHLSFEDLARQVGELHALVSSKRKERK